MKNKLNIIRELKRRGYTITQTADESFLAEKETFWGKFSYDAGIGQNYSHIKWGRTLLIGLFTYGMGLLFVGLWWLYKKGSMQEEVSSLIKGIE